MIYKYSLLKDMPKFPAGFSKSFDDTDEWSEYYEGAWLISLHKNHSDWVKKEIDSTYFKDLECPLCHHTDTFQTEYESYRTCDDDVYSRRVTIYLHCACGEKIELCRVLANSVAYNSKI